ncbi:MAG: hypothetical protein BJG00_005615 [Limnothrix sp. CACIAM 69d]|nr:MAG: hypothetical protein BJG00_005615 [Limnothrix sp. CACIAM 69d]
MMRMVSRFHERHSLTQRLAGKNRPFERFCSVTAEANDATGLGFVSVVDRGLLLSLWSVAENLFSDPPKSGSTVAKSGKQGG